MATSIVDISVTLFPNHSEVVVSPLSGREVIRRVSTVTRQVNFLDHYPREKEPVYLFNGKVSEEKFHISKLLLRADSFIPLIKGSVEATRQGSIIFLSYSLFPSSRFFLGFWLIVSILFSLFFGIFRQDLPLASLCLVLGAANFAFSWSHFQRKVRDSRETLFHLLSLQTKDHP